MTDWGVTDDPATTARAYVLNEHPDLVARTLECADAVAAGWDAESTTEAEHVGERLQVLLERAGVIQRLPDVLKGAVGAIGGTLSAPPVPAPPYIVVGSRGPILRATTDRGRLVVTLQVFEVDRTAAGPPRYVRSAETPGEAVVVELRSE